MTHSIDAPLPPPGTTSGATSPSTSSPSTGSSTTDVAKDEARNVGQTATEAGSQVASTAADQAKEVTQETRRQAQDLLEQGRSQVREQAGSQQQKAAQGLSSLAQELRGMVQGDGSTSGPAHDLVQQATDKIEEFAGWLQNREPADLLNEVRNFARRKPGVFLLGAAAAGVLAGRLTSGVKAAHTGSGASGGMHRGGDNGPNYVVDTTPTYQGTGTDYTGTTSTGQYPSTTAATGAPLPPPPYGTVPPAGSVVPPGAPAGWDDPARRTGGVS